MTEANRSSRFLPLPGEGAALAASFVSFTLLLACYYVLRPVRDALVATLGAGSIKYLSSTVFIVMLGIVPVFGWLVARVPRPRLLPGLYGFFIVNLACFALAFARLGTQGSLADWAARAFYVWVTVFNMFAVSVFWSRMAEIWSEPQGRRLFGMISAGGSLGGLLGPLLARALAANLAISGLIWVSAALLSGSLCGLLVLTRRAPVIAPGETAALVTEPSGGALLEGLYLIGRTPFLAGIAGLVSLGSMIAMIVYVEMARLVGSTFADTVARTQFFSSRDLIVNALAFVLQLFVISQITRRLGVGWALMTCAILVTLGFVALGLDPTLSTLTVVSVLLRCTEFGLAKPSRDMLYTVVPPAAKYQAKNVIDTAVTRGSDVVSNWLQALVGRLGVGLGGWGWLGAGLCVLLGVLASRVGRGYRLRGGT